MHKNHTSMSNMSKNNYRHLLLMVVLSFISMYVLMYAMVNRLKNVYNNLNQFIIAGSILAGLIFFLLIRQQAAISNKQFLRSMIPHHAGAILMCEQAPINDPEIEDLCGIIIASQQEEIEQMKDKLLELGQ